MRRVVTSVVPTRNTTSRSASTTSISRLARAEPLHLAQALGRDEHLLALRQHAHALQVAHREPVGVGGDEPQAARRDAVSSTPVRIGRASSFDAAGTTWRSASANGAASTRTPAPSRLGEAREVGGRQRAQRRAEPARLELGFVVARLHVDTVPASSLRTISENGRAGTTALPVAVDVGRDRDPDRELEVGADQLERRRRLSVTRSPDSTGSAPVRDATARWAVATASARVSRSQRNFTRGLLRTGSAMILRVVVVVGLWIGDDTRL